MKNEFLRGLKAGFPIGLGYLSVSFAFGIFAVSSGLVPWEAVLISLTNVTSAGQLAAVPMIVGGAGVAELAMTQFFINLRYSLMGVSLSQKMDKSVRLFDRFVIAFVDTDEVFAVASTEKGSVCRSFLYGLILLPYVGWGLGTALGALIGSVCPAIIVNALGVAIYGMFVAIVVPPAKKERPVLLCVLSAALLSVIFHYVPVLNQISEGFIIILCSVISATVMSLIAPVKEANQS